MPNIIKIVDFRPKNSLLFAKVVEKKKATARKECVRALSNFSKGNNAVSLGKGVWPQVRAGPNPGSCQKN